MDQTPVPIAGSPVTTRDGVEVLDPYRGDVIAEVPLCGQDEVARACEHAEVVKRREDFAQHERVAVLERTRTLLAERTEELARTIALEAGKPMRTARGEVLRAVETFAVAAAEARRLGGEVVPLGASSSGVGKLGFSLRVPAGVVAAISPFNFPLNLVAHKLAPAIAAGCPVVLKPAPQTPLSALALVDLLVEAGLPGDWISVVTDRRAEAGGPLVEHPVPAVVTFTGSVPVGWGIAAAAPRKKVLLELGSNAPMIVEAGVDLDDLVERCLPAGFGFAGQSCISLQRLLVHRSIHAEMVDALATAADALVVGDPLDEATDVGPLISPPEATRVRGWVAEALDAGGQLVTHGHLDRSGPDDDGPDRGGDAMVRPTIVDGVDLDCALWRSEVFGPVIAVRAFDTVDEAFALANDSDFGLHASVFTKDLATALRAVRELEFGGVLVNEVPTWRADQQPYGGVRDAGNTREGPAYAIHEMTTERFVSLQP